MEVEDQLIKIFIGHPKNNNGSDHCGGGYAEDDYAYVYVAVWFK